MAWSGLPPFAPVPGLGTYSGGAARLPGSGAGPTGGWGGWEAGTLPREPLGRRPGAAGEGGTKGLILPVRSRWHRQGRWRKPRGPGGQAQAGPPNHGLLFPAGCWRRKPAELPTLSCASGDGDQRSCCPLRWALPPVAAPLRCALAGLPLSRVAGSAPRFQATPSPGPPAFPPTPPSPTRGARSPRPGSLSPPDTRSLAPARPSPRRSAGLGVPWRNPRPRPRSWCGRFAPCRILQIPRARPLQPAALERPRRPRGKEALSREREKSPRPPARRPGASPWGKDARCRPPRPPPPAPRRAREAQVSAETGARPRAFWGRP